ncbi:MAG: hypothetical protein JHC98_07695 [Thermoleophilaceae bacterium]|nr:hypothetical protein [Thermoleophilaceae bacterium]
MLQGESSRGNYGTLERWTVAMFALSFILPVIVPAIICLVFAKYWTTREKLIALFAPVLFYFVLAMIVTADIGMQNWIRIPMMVTAPGIAFIFSAIYLHTRDRASRSLREGSTWPSNA